MPKAPIQRYCRKIVVFINFLSSTVKLQWKSELEDFVLALYLTQTLTTKTPLAILTAATNCKRSNSKLKVDPRKCTSKIRTK